MHQQIGLQARCGPAQRLRLPPAARIPAPCSHATVANQPARRWLRCALDPRDAQPRGLHLPLHRPPARRPCAVVLRRGRLRDHRRGWIAEHASRGPDVDAARRAPFGLARPAHARSPAAGLQLPLPLSTLQPPAHRFPHGAILRTDARECEDLLRRLLDDLSTWAEMPPRPCARAPPSTWSTPRSCALATRAAAINHGFPARGAQCAAALRPPAPRAPAPAPADLARELGLGSERFLRLFKATYGMAPRRWLLESRIAEARFRLAHAHEPIGAIAEALGYSDRPRFNRQFKAPWSERTPRAYRADPRAESASGATQASMPARLRRRAARKSARHGERALERGRRLLRPGLGRG